MWKKALLIAALMLSVPGNVSAHSWYDGDCCSNQDCDVAKVTKHSDGSYEVRMWGYKTHTDQQTEIRKSKDKNYHACIVFERSGGRDPVPVVRCLYVPDLDQLS